MRKVVVADSSTARVERLRRALKAACKTLNETADAYLIGDAARHVNETAAWCREQDY